MSQNLKTKNNRRIFVCKKTKYILLVLVFAFLLSCNIDSNPTGLGGFFSPARAENGQSQTNPTANENATITVVKKDWQAKKSPEFKIEYAKSGTVKNFLQKLTSLFKRKNVEATLISENGKESQNMKINEDFIVSYNFSGATVKLLPKIERKPGRYVLEAKFRSGVEEFQLIQDFLWGVLAINTNKSIYFPEEEAKLAIGVLNKNGDMVCDARVILEIADPHSKTTTLSTENGGIAINSEVCRSHELTLEPDYHALYKIGGAGSYQLVLTAETSAGTYRIKDSFEVREKKPFDAERTGPTRIYPPNHYPMTLSITANQDFDGVIKEEVPSSFEIERVDAGDQQAFQIQNSSGQGKKELVWNVRMRKGEKKGLSYKFRAPDESPQFYLMGPLQFIEKEKTVYKELRQWQIAADADPNMMLFWDGNCASPPLQIGTWFLMRTERPFMIRLMADFFPEATLPIVGWPEAH